ncbi:uncharacterized protein NPIL_49771 [Nephila pilipes]|uniref:Uncharacterized protein n=1 Tax=Nephila pilipes TaxID=299642 RepID=A0A8X6N233_NEPPI|nr:uncharacterized protein NPIL_49771 [Nephila pilipes]
MEERGDSIASSSSRNEETGNKWNCRSKKLTKKKISLNHLLKVICASQESCIDWLKNKGLIPKVVFCPNCSHNMTFEAQESAVDGFIWTCKECKIDPPHLSTRHGSWLEGKELSLVDILLFTYLWTRNFSEAQIIKETNMEPDTAKEWSKMYLGICEAVQKRNTLLDENCDESVSKPSNLSPISAWRKKNKSKDPFLEFLKDADSL